jgi:hypothetical protein
VFVKKGARAREFAAILPKTPRKSAATPDILTCADLPQKALF